MRYLFSLAVVLSLLWLGMSGVYKPLMYILGAGSVVFVVWMCHNRETLLEVVCVCVCTRVCVSE